MRFVPHCTQNLLNMINNWIFYYNSGVHTHTHEKYVKQRTVAKSRITTVYTNKSK